MFRQRIRAGQPGDQMRPPAFGFVPLFPALPFGRQAGRWMLSLETPALFCAQDNLGLCFTSLSGSHTPALYAEATASSIPTVCVHLAMTLPRNICITCTTSDAQQR